jgi:hypothetical protein
MHIKLTWNHSICFCLLILISVSCTNKNESNLQNALKLAGPNKKELKKVLSHYKKDPADSLKYKAACFMIENMQWHYGKKVEPDRRLWDLFVLEDSLVVSYMRNPDFYKNKDAFNGYKYRLKKMFVKEAISKTVIGNEFVSDLQTLNAASIIENIDLAFEVRNNWLKEMPDSIFFEHILPYRVNQEPVYPVREKLNQHFSAIAEIQARDTNMTDAISFLNRYMNLFNWDWDEENIQMPDLGFYNIFYWHNQSLTCQHQVAVFAQILRSIGIPVAEVFTPKWRDNNLGHNWCVVPDSNGRLTLFTAVYQNPGDVYLPHSPAAASKLYMRTYSAQPETPWFLRASGEVLPPGFETPCLKDVTKEFVPVTDVELKLNVELPDHNLCWFSLFIQGKWAPIGWGVVNKTTNTVLFQNIPVGLTGLACVFKNGEAVPVSDLITINAAGTQVVKPENKTETLLLTRKFPVKTRLQYFTKDIIGTKIQGANLSDFSDSTTLCTITDTLRPYLQDVTFINTKNYRYYRIYAPTWLLHVAEVEFLTETKIYGTVEASPLPVFNRPIAKPKVFYKYSGEIVAANPDSTAFDGNMLTYSLQKWVGLDLGIPRNLNRIRIAPRNAHNGIVPGDNYQLLYWNNGWVPAEIKQADYNFIEFENIPSKTLYWLRNLDHGKEEQPFFYRNGKQVFSNQADVEI